MNLKHWKSHLPEAYSLAGLSLTSKKETLLTSNQTDSSTEQEKEVTVAAFEVLTRYFFTMASKGAPFGPVSRIKERFGLTLEESLGLSEGPFLRLAETYWTFKLELTELRSSHGLTPLCQILQEIELDVASVFFPTPGPAVTPIKLRRVKQRQMLEELAPDMDIEKFLSENPYLRSKEKGMRCVPLISGVAYWVFAAGLVYFLPHIVTVIIGVFLLWYGWGNIKVGLFGSQELIDAMTLTPDAHKDEEVVEEWSRIQKIE